MSVEVVIEALFNCQHQALYVFYFEMRPLYIMNCLMQKGEHISA